MYNDDVMKAWERYRNGTEWSQRNQLFRANSFYNSLFSQELIKSHMI